MTRAFRLFFCIAAGSALCAASGGGPAKASPDWSFNATVIEACSCPMFCHCYFDAAAAEASAKPPLGETMKTCRFNFGIKINKGNYGPVKLDGLKFWLAGDVEWNVMTFDPSASKEQRDAVVRIASLLYPLDWTITQITPDASIEWTADKESATARLGGGKIAEVRLRRNPGMTRDPVVIKNLRYWGATRNEGFILMPNQIEAYRAGSHPFEYRGTNGFMITVDLNSKDSSGIGWEAAP